jgi:hypothetical protein
MRYTMTLDALSKASGISIRRIKDLHSVGLLHSPGDPVDLWPEENLKIISDYAGTRQAKWIHKASMRSALIQACIINDPPRTPPAHEVLVESISPTDLVLGTEVLRFTKNDNAVATIDEVIGEALLLLRSTVFIIPQHCVFKALVLMSEGYSPCWVRYFGGCVRTTIDMMGSLTGLTPSQLGSDMALGAAPVFEWACERLGITPVPHHTPKTPDALLTSQEGDQWVEYAVFKTDGVPTVEPIGVLA